MTTDSILGPYTMVQEGLRPLNMDAGDFDLAVAEDGKGYYYFERVHSETICADLTEDYLGVTGFYSTHFPQPGLFTILGNPHARDESQTSYHSQISSIFKVPGKKDLYIACADRWVPDHMEWQYPVYRDLFEGMFIRKDICADDLSEEQKLILGDASRDTSISDYVWLPIRFEEPDKEHPLGMVSIDWVDEWRIEDYE